MSVCDSTEMATGEGRPRDVLKYFLLAVLAVLFVLQFSYSFHSYFASRSSPLLGPPAPSSNSGPRKDRSPPQRRLNASGALLNYNHLLGNEASSRQSLNRTLQVLSQSPSLLTSSIYASSDTSSTHESSTYTAPFSQALFYDPNGPTWKSGSFCESYVERTFQTPVAVCGPEPAAEHNIKCYRNSQSKVMVYCILESVFLSGPRAVGAGLDTGLLTGADRSCPTLSVSGVEKTSERNSRNRKLLDSISKRESKPSASCEEWINKTAFLYTADQAVHIYFRMNAYYSLHKAISREGVAPGDFLVIKDPNRSNYLFSEWEMAKLFPEMVTVNELPNKTLCFKKLVVVPFSFSGIPFRCKMEGNVRTKCFNCKGRGLYGSSFYSFRQRVISACGLVDKEGYSWNRITIVSRTPYQRWRKDDPNKFQRILGNENDLVKALRNSFPNTNVTVAHMEKMDICKQISLANSADVLIGVHGAGLVHLWWLQEHALALELNPTYEQSNPSFKMLSTLSGRNYASITVSGSQHKVTVKVDSVVKLLKSKTHLS